MNLISPRFICGNRGDIASRYGILNTLQRGGALVSAVFACRAAHLPEALQRSVLPYGLMYNIWPRWQGIQALRRASAVIWTGGLDIQDDSSLCIRFESRQRRADPISSDREVRQNVGTGLIGHTHSGNAGISLGCRYFYSG